jgi:hypothetical protein
MRLQNATHEAHPWLITQIAPDFKLLDVWRVPAQGGQDDFAALLEIVTSLDPLNSDSRATRALFALRFRLGAWLGWDESPSKPVIPGSTETSLSARIPAALRDTVMPPIAVGSTTFVPIYRTEDEWVAEISNSTVHAAMQLVWVRERDGVYHGQMGVYVKPRGRFGAAYMALIGPFRHLIVYPALMRQIARAWEGRHRQGSSPPEAR